MINSNESNRFLNRTAPEDHIQNDCDYPVIQWNNGNPGAAGVLANGGFELPLKDFKDLVVSEILEIPHRNGIVTELGYLLPVMHLAIVQSHTTYYKENGEAILWSATPRFDEGYRSRTLYFCYTAEIEETTRLTAVVLSVKSKVAQEFKTLLRSFRSQVLATADALGGGRSAHYFFYVPVGSNGRETIQGGPQGSYTIAPPVPYWDRGITGRDAEGQIEILRELAIPDYLYQHIINQGWDEAKAWQESLINSGGDLDNDADDNNNSQVQDQSQPRRQKNGNGNGNGKGKAEQLKALETFLGRTRIELDLNEDETRAILKELGQTSFTAERAEELVQVLYDQLNSSATTETALLVVANRECGKYYENIHHLRNSIKKIKPGFDYPPEVDQSVQWQTILAMLIDHAQAGNGN